MAASVLSEHITTRNLEVHVFEKRPSFGRKLLIAGSSGLNITHAAPLNEFVKHYSGFNRETWARLLSAFGPAEWIQFIQELGLETFLGTSSRYFVKEMKAANLLKAWISKLEQQGVRFFPSSEWKIENPSSPFTHFRNEQYDAVGFFLGGGSWEETEPSWLKSFAQAGIKTVPFYPSNVGYEVSWKKEFLKEAEGKPFKNIQLTTSLGTKAGEMVVTQYGLEGTPIYFLGEIGQAYLDLKPALTEAEVLERLKSVKENLSPIRRAKKVLGLNDTALALLFHHTTEQEKTHLESFAKAIKSFPLKLEKPRPLVEAISSGGGIDLSELSMNPNSEFMITKFPRVFCGGEMLNWTAPTGGFLIQGCVTQGAIIGKNLLHYVHS